MRHQSLRKQWPLKELPPLETLLGRDDYPTIALSKGPRKLDPSVTDGARSGIPSHVVLVACKSMLTPCIFFGLHTHNNYSIVFKKKNLWRMIGVSNMFLKCHLVVRVVVVVIDTVS